MAALDKSGFLSKWSSLFADNSSRAISEEDLRDFRQDIADSFLNKTDDAYITNAVTASGTDTYTATLSPAISSYATNARYYILFTNANTGAATLNLNGLGAKTIIKNGSSALSAGDIAAGQVIELVYDGTSMQIIGKYGADAADVADKWSLSTGGALTGDAEITGSGTHSIDFGTLSDKVNDVNIYAEGAVNIDAIGVVVQRSAEEVIFYAPSVSFAEGSGGVLHLNINTSNGVLDWDNEGLLIQLTGDLSSSLQMDEGIVLNSGVDIDLIAVENIDASAEVISLNSTTANIIATDINITGSTVIDGSVTLSDFESLSDSSDEYGIAFLSRLGAVFKAAAVRWNETLKQLSIDGTQAIWSAIAGVTNGNMGIKALESVSEAFKIFDNTGNFFSVGVESAKRVVRIFTNFRLYNGVAYNEAEFKSVDCPASVTTVLKTITMPENTIMTVDVTNIAIHNVDQDCIFGHAQFTFKNDSGTVTNLSQDELRYDRQYSTIGTDGYVTSSVSRIDASISSSDVSINFVNTVAKTTLTQCEIKTNIVILPI